MSPDSTSQWSGTTDLFSVRCKKCGHRMSARSFDRLMAAFEDHASWVNASADRATDPHFENAINAPLAATRTIGASLYGGR